MLPELNMDILRFITAGSIDDGKSTLIGRLLLDTSNIKDDILDSVSQGGANEINLAYITDGLRAEREAGITIDVAYKYFTTPQRKFIITDAPGHFQYTKNLVTGASNADVMIILIDATIGISAQTRRNALVASFLKMKHVVVAINKMDLVGFSETIFNAIKNEFVQATRSIDLPQITFIPVSALRGDNVTVVSESMTWYASTTLLHFLEDCKPRTINETIELRLSVQYSKDGHIFGRLISGALKIGDEVCINPSGKLAEIRKVVHDKTETRSAFKEDEVCIELTSGIPLKRGDLISGKLSRPICARELDATICWLDDASPLDLNKDYILRIAAAETFCRIVEITSKTDNDTYQQHTGQVTVSVNEFAMVKIRTKENIAFDSFQLSAGTGRAILIDKATNNTSGALIIT